MHSSPSKIYRVFQWHTFVHLIISIGALASAAGFPSHAAETFLLTSPDGNIEATITLPSADNGDRPRWSARFREKPILTNCGLGLSVADEGELFKNVRLLKTIKRAHDQRIPVLFGKSDHANDRFNEIRFIFETAAKARVDAVFRCYNDAIALRYELPGNEVSSNVVITEESTSFQPEGNPSAYVQYLEHHKTSHEHNVVRTPCREIRRDALLDMPLTLHWPDNVCVAITEASLRRYAGMALMRSSEPDDPEALVSKLTPRPDGSKVAAALPLKTPWRVVLIGERPGELLESNTIYCLNDPPSFEDSSWIQPGKITFHWWNGDVYDGEPGLPALSTEMARKYIDFCARHDLPIHSISSTESPTTPWYRQTRTGVAPGPDTDVTRPRKEFDLKAVKQYADSKGVRLWTWVHQAALHGRVEEAFAAFEAMGWSGMMVDFFDHDDQSHVEFAEEILEAAARHHILIHFHGIWKPTGLERTYPNLMNHEGALNLEYLKWSDRCTPEHNLNMAFTRLIAGPMDYHLGGFRSLPRDQFEPRHVAPHVLGTRCHMLAMYVCFDNPAPMIADYPTAYEGEPGFDFLKTVPTWWDETRVLVDKIGECLVTARRRGDDWYLGGMSAAQSHDLAIPLAFLEQENYTATIWRDAEDADIYPNRLITENRNATPEDSLKVKLAKGGGFAARLELKERE